ncbi:MAG TPA: LptF/LptG family permease [Candidatus Gastranaerophilales bacterium]|nr:LptF/LptG family permease [Candidatus Gastranaerophilales bacterium]
MFLKLKLLDKYILSQVLISTIFGVLLFIILWISPEILFKIIKKFINGDISLELAIRLFFLEIPEILPKAIPVGMMLGGLFVFDRLSKDSELTIMRMSGVSIFRLTLPIVFLSIIGMWISFLIYANLIPYSTSEIKFLKKDSFQSHFVYIDKKKNESPKQILIVGGYNGTNLYDIKLLQFSDRVQADTPLMRNIITAQYTQIKDDHWELFNGIKYEIAPDGVYKKIEKFEKIDIFDRETTKTAEQLLIYSTKRPREMTNKELKDYITLLEKLDMPEEYRFSLSKFYQRYSHSFGCLLLSFCGVLLGINRPREKRLIGFTLAAVLIFSYYIFIPFLDMLAQMGTLTPVIAAWFPNLIILTTITLLIKYKNI